MKLMTKEKIKEVDGPLLIQYIDCWSKNEELSLQEDLLYCKSDGKIIAVDNTSGNCFVEEFKNEKSAKNWLLGINEKDNLEM